MSREPRDEGRAHSTSAEDAAGEGNRACSLPNHVHIIDCLTTKRDAVDASRPNTRDLGAYTQDIRVDQ